MRIVNGYVFHAISLRFFPDFNTSIRAFRNFFSGKKVISAQVRRCPKTWGIGETCTLGLEHDPRPAASGGTQDLGHSFSQYGPPGRQITYMYCKLRNG